MQGVRLALEYMLVSIVIINYNTFQLTCDCIASVIAYTKEVDYEIILVDNASTKDDPDDFLVKFPSINLVKSKENGGFAKGNNLGISHAKGDLILLLNSDTYLTEDCISKAAYKYQEIAHLGALSVKVVYPDGRYQNMARRFRSIRNELLDIMRPLLLLLPYRQRAILMLNQYFKGDFSTGCDWVSGAFMMMPKDMIGKLEGGRLDERFFMYGEDHLWCYQFTELGYTNYYYADALVYHIANASTEPAKQLKLLKTMMKHELEIMAYRKGKGAYYILFKWIFSAKEYFRYYVKVMMWKLLKHKMR
ncbi:MAG: glycosyltransferase family 2 protein [Flavipsychrobacter sp.]